MPERGWKKYGIGGIVEDPGRGIEYRTGDWRSQHAIYDKEKCIRCGVCYLFCPEGCIKLQSDGSIEIGDFHCKGCGICSKECITGAITMAEGGEK